MSKNFSNIIGESLAFVPYQLPVALCTPLKADPAVVSIPIKWTAQYGASTSKPNVAVQINLADGKQPVAILDAIRSVKIDNTFCPVPVYVQFPDTLDTVVCPAGDLVILPVFTNSQQCVVFAQGFFDGMNCQTTVELTNIMLQGVHIPSEDTNDIRATVSYISPNFANFSPWSFNNVPIGVAATDRIVVVMINMGEYGASQTPTSVTIAGIPAIRAKLSSHAGAFGGNPTLEIADIWYAVVPSGVTANIIINGAGGAAGAMSGYITVGEIYNASSPTPIASAETGGAGGSVGTLSLSMACLVGSISFFAMGRIGGTSFAPFTAVAPAAIISAQQVNPAVATYASEACAQNASTINGIQQTNITTNTGPDGSYALAGAMWN